MAPTLKNAPRYTESDLIAALNKVRNGMAIRSASRIYGIPRSTLSDKFHGKVSKEFFRRGPTPYLNKEEENKIVEWFVKLENCGFTGKSEYILNAVQKLIIDGKRKTPFKNGRPGRKWYSSFLKRNSAITDKIPKPVKKEPGFMTKQSIKNWFQKLENYLKSIGSFDILSNPKRIYSGDEAHFSICPKSWKILAPKPFKNVININMNEKDTLTVFSLFSAAGQTLPPLLVLPYKRPPKELVKSMPNEWYFGNSGTGWITYDTFFNFIKGFDDWLTANKIKRPIILFINGHKAHLSLALSEFCDSHGIILYALPPTNILQPADLSVFKPLKSEWTKTVSEWLALPKNIDNPITKSNFWEVLQMVLQKDGLQDSIKNAFRHCGLYPFNSNAIDYSKRNLNRQDNFATDSNMLSDEEYSECNEKSTENLADNLNISSDDLDISLSVINKLKNHLQQEGINVEQLKEILSNAKNDDSDADFAGTFAATEFIDTSANGTEVQEAMFIEQGDHSFMM